MLTSDLLLHAYRNAVFPMAMEGGEIAWFSPDPRSIIPLDRFHIPHGLKRALKKRVFEVRVNTAFEEVIRGCARREETWISEEIVASYSDLHRRGHAHSVETWYEGRLAGGLYGVSLGGAFFGESMFSEVTDASKVALYELVMRLREQRFGLLDIQWTTSHLKSFGAIEVPRSVYRQILDECVNQDCRFAQQPPGIS